MMSVVQTDFTDENVLFSNLYLHTKICLVSKIIFHTENLLPEFMLHVKILCFVSDLILHTKLWYIRTYSTHENMMSYV